MHVHRNRLAGLFIFLVASILQVDRCHRIGEGSYFEEVYRHFTRRSEGLLLLNAMIVKHACLD